MVMYEKHAIGITEIRFQKLFVGGRGLQYLQLNYRNVKE